MKKIFRVILLFILYSSGLYAQNDCPDAIVVCGNDDYYGLDATGVGIQELNSAENVCSSQENNSIWLKIIIKDGGTLGFTITPEEIDDLVVDFDFWLFGPNVECDELDEAIRCSTTNPLAAGQDYNTTGMNDTETDVSEGPGPDGNSFIQWIEAEDGDIYYLIIDRPHGSSNFSIEWTGTATFHDIPVFNNPNNIPIDLSECDDGEVYDGITTFNLEQHAAMFIGDQTGVSLTYHVSINDMMTGENPIESPSTFQNTSTTQTIYMKMTDVVTGCFSNETFEIVVTPHIDEVVNLVACDNDGINDGITAFDLTENEIVLGNPDNIEIDYYEDNDGIPHEDPITNIENYTNTENPQIIHVIVTNTVTGCSATGTFNLSVVSPVAGTPQNLYVCSGNGIGIFDLTENTAAIANGSTDAVITYHISEEDAESGENHIGTWYQNTTPYESDQLWARRELMDGECYDVVSFIVEAQPNPIFNNPDSISLSITKCDNDGVDDMVTTFDLTQYETMFIADQTDIAITYHTSFSGAVNGEDRIDEPEAYNNTSDSQWIYLRMTNLLTECFSSWAFQITVTPGIGVPNDFSVCDDDGFFEFNLANNDDVIANTATNASITYYTSEEDAENAIDAVGSLYQNQTAYTSEQIWVRMEKENEECIAFTSFTINVHPIPSFNTPNGLLPDMIRCDNDGIADESIEFDLTSNENLLAGSSENIIFYYYEDIGGQPAPNPLASPEAYSNVGNPQLIHYRTLNTITGCFTLGTFTLTVTPGAGLPDDLAICEDEDGIATFNLAINNNLVANGNEDTIVTYYRTEEDAENNENDIGYTYQNQTPYSTETLWARLDKTTESCTDYVSFTIGVYNIPTFESEDNMPPNIISCDNDAIDDGIISFNLTSNEAAMQGSQENMLFTYYEDEDGTPKDTPILNPENYYNIANPQVIHVTITNSVTGCSATNTFTLAVLPGAGEPENLYLCSDNGFAEFDLTLNNEAVANGNDDAAITYYLTEDDALNGTNDIGTLYENTTPYESEQIWVRTDVLNDGCYDVTSFTINIVPEPTVNNHNNINVNLTKCDDDNVDDGVTTFNLTQHSAMFIGTQNGITITYHTSAEDTASGENAITNPEEYRNITMPQTIYVRMNTLADCYTQTQFILNIDNTVQTGIPEDILSCDSEENGYQLFDLHKNDSLIKNGEPNTVVTYYASAQDAENGTNKLNRFYTNNTPYTNQTIWARLEYASGCVGYGITSFTIAILPLPEIEYTIDVTDFTVARNRITVNIATNPGDYEFSIDNVLFSENNVFDNLTPGIYTIYVRAKNNCKTIEIEIPILNYPKFFTPNGDGTNELWNVKYLYYFPDARVFIFDRYGKVLTSYAGNQQGWDGTYNGHNLPATDYWFKIEFNSGRTINGHFAMVR
ncbi:T9SS type B sorting domain-containing protein [Flavobacterium litorale]|uniref:T9SS type B sorting domain-containing protein n=1 Tax=Flavobacterium litorale TaxID=2856519 RepID=A0ABX8VBZ1_9FLAO|nr:T9SS type B sorting domain-containing protein [Flavobacterium litorale]QYJ68169.1 T9SS type B sorting domain-containing protein [Flavobacterium litorale]